MFFEYPGLLWLLVIPALLVLHYIYLELSERHPHLRVSSADLGRAIAITIITSAKILSRKGICLMTAISDFPPAIQGTEDETLR